MKQHIEHIEEEKRAASAELPQKVPSDAAAAEAKKEEEIRRENRKALKFYIPTLLLCAAAGGAMGFFVSCKGMRDAAGWLEDWIREALFQIAPYLVIGVILAALGLSFYEYRQAKKLYAAFDEDQEPDGAEEGDDLYGQADRKLSFSTTVAGVGMIVAMMCFTPVFCDMDRHLQAHAALTLIVVAFFIAGLFLIVRMQQAQVDFNKRMAPYLKGSVYDRNFHEKWEESCDEAEKLVIYKASYRAFRVANTACSIGWAVLTVGTMVFHYGCLPSVVLAALWLLMNVSYCRHAMALEHGGLNR